MAVTFTNEIHNAILTRVNATSFPRVTYDPNTGIRSVSDTVFASPKTFLAQPEQAEFVDGQNRRTFTRSRDGFTWILDLSWSVPVETETFEDDLANNPIKIPRETSGLDRQIIIELENVQHFIPPLGQPASGTSVRLTLNAGLSPK